MRLEHLEFLLVQPNLTHWTHHGSSGNCIAGKAVAPLPARAWLVFFCWYDCENVVRTFVGSFKAEKIYILPVRSLILRPESFALSFNIPIGTSLSLDRQFSAVSESSLTLILSTTFHHQQPQEHPDSTRSSVEILSKLTYKITQCTTLLRPHCTIATLLN